MTAITTSASAVAIEIINTKDLGLCPILADAVEEAGLLDGDRSDIQELRAAVVFGRPPYRSAVGRILCRLLGIKIVVGQAYDDRRGRYTARRVNAEKVAQGAAYAAILNGDRRWWEVRDGGSVPNNYGYAAATDGVLAVAKFDRGSNTVFAQYWASRLPANKVTAAGVAALFGYRDLCDGRVSEVRQAACKERLYAAHDALIAVASAQS